MRILNKRVHGVPEGAVYVGRPSVFGNPFTHIADRRTRAEFVVASRDEAVDMYEEYFLRRVEAEPEFRTAVLALAGKDLVCWCAPERCHASVIIHWLQDQDEGGER